MTPKAQPTPARTVKAPSGQFRAQAPHSIHASRLTIHTLLRSSTKTACGHTWIHMPHPLHFVRLSSSVVTSCRYRSILFAPFPAARPFQDFWVGAHRAGARHSNSPITKSMIPITALDIWIGIAIRISFFTPDNDVYVELPVKFIPIILVAAGKRKSHPIIDSRL